MRPGRSIARAASPVWDVLFPPACWVDGNLVQDDHGGKGGLAGNGLSETARHAIGRLAFQPYCLHCGLTVGPYELHDARDPCARCGTREVGVVRIARVGTCSEPLVTLVHRLKFGRSWELGDVLAPFLYSAMLRVSEIAAVPVDVMIPVPLHWLRRARRGFNQAEELARSVGKLSHWPMVHALHRRRHTSEQALASSPTARAANLRGAFALMRAAKRGALADKHVWLLDDVSTTGATLHAAATALRKLPSGMRPASINAAVLCVTDNYSPPAT